jgi:hypothetical protein
MMLRITISLLMIISIFLFPDCTFGQDKPRWYDINGYVSTMQNAVFDQFEDDWTNSGIIHNRINLKIFAGSSVTVNAAFRNRLITGDMIRYNTVYAELAGNDQGIADLSWNLAEGNSMILNSTIDRLSINYTSERFRIDLGRQRINWGQTLVWNPNDIFNTYSYFDFDYVERPGSDALRVQYFPDFTSVVDVAAKIDNNNDLTVAALYRFNVKGYDIQFLGGYADGENLMLGSGWSGSLGSLSFRGEISWFEPVGELSDSSATALLTAGFDHTLSGNSMLQFQVMYCNNPVDLSDFTTLYNRSLSASELAFSQLSWFAGYRRDITPLLNLGLSAIWYPGLKGYFAGPELNYSLSEDVAFSFLLQHFNALLGGDRMNLNLGFIRVKYNF